MGKIEGIFLDLDSACKLSSFDKKIERLKRDKSLSDALLIAEKQKNGILERKIKDNLEMIEVYLSMRLMELEKNNNTDKFIDSMKTLLKSVIQEKEQPIVYVNYKKYGERK